MASERRFRCGQRSGSEAAQQVPPEQPNAGTEIQQAREQYRRYIADQEFRNRRARAEKRSREQRAGHASRKKMRLCHFRSMVSSVTENHGRSTEATGPNVAPASATLTR